MVSLPVVELKILPKVSPRIGQAFVVPQIDFLVLHRPPQTLREYVVKDPAPPPTGVVRPDEADDRFAAGKGYDLEGRVVWARDRAGAVSRFEYDGFGRMVKATDPLGNVVTYVYDDVDNLRE